ncbi:MAG: large-conductance mechanosensitive channel protein MscL [Porphyromonadaceae bacterium]|nr:large-conductance mechanosensitive channel protein MscL [Porphyromonadaceae bacterium]
MGKLIQEFKDFAMKGNVMDMAVGIIIGGAFGKIVSSFVNDIIMPPIGLLLGGVNFTDLKLTLKEGVAEQINAAGEVVSPAVDAVTLNYGSFLQVTVDFLIIALAIFLMVKGMNSLRKKQEEEPAGPAPDPADIALLKEIRDELKKRN